MRPGPHGLRNVAGGDAEQSGKQGGKKRGGDGRRPTGGGRFALKEVNPRELPPRSGWPCLRAGEALRAGDTSGA